jgi:lactoylglutathione lyase
LKLAKPALDVGLYTNQLDPSLAFWQDQVGLTYSEMLPLGGGARQHRHAIGDSVLKVNHSRHELEVGDSGLSKLSIYSASVEEPAQLLDPNGNDIDLCPITAQSPNLTLTLAVTDLARSQEFYAQTLGLPQDDESGFRAGASQILLTQGGKLGEVPQKALGLRYMTFQIFDVVAEHAYVISHGGSEGMAPVRLGEVAFISFVRDPDGNWIELSQRKSITGSLA